MFKRILKYCILLLLGVVVTACCCMAPYPSHHQECYQYSNGTVDCYRDYYLYSS
jgi:hypothetical protein